VILVAPTEPRPLRDLGTVSSLPEKLGVDYLISSESMGTVGIQRKEVSDLVASVRDGRLQRELPLMQRLDIAILLVEGTIQWTESGENVNLRTKWTRAQHLGVLWSIQSRGIWINCVGNLAESGQYLLLLSKWAEKERHSSLNDRPKNGSVSFASQERAEKMWVLQGLNGMGEGLAGRILDHFGELPLTWTITADELSQVPGIGKTKARKLIDQLGSLIEDVEL
jgi:ERCC4-type nuclease